MLLEQIGTPLVLRNVSTPRPSGDQLLVRVSACAVCRTDLHIVDGELPHPKLPLILGHEIVGRVEALGRNVDTFHIGDRVGIPWLGWTCGQCKFCQSNRENLCDRARFTGYTIDGGYAEFTVADARFCFRLPDVFDDVGAAPLLCAGLIGYRSLHKKRTTQNASVFTVSVPPLTSSRRSHVFKVAKFSLSRVQAMQKVKGLRASSARFGPAVQMKCLRKSLMRPLSSRPSDRSCLLRCARSTKVVSSSAAEFT